MRISRVLKIVLLSSVTLLVATSKFEQTDSHVINNDVVAVQKVDPGLMAMVSSGISSLVSDVKCELPEFYKDKQDVIHKVKSGETLSSIFSKYNANQQGVLSLVNQIKEAGHPSSLKLGEEIKLELAGDEVVSFQKNLDDGKQIQIDGNSVRGYDVNVVVPNVIEVERRASGVITSSFFSAAASQNVPYEMIDQLVDLFSSRVEFAKSLQVGDTFSVIYTEKVSDSGQFIGAGSVKAASIKNKDKFMAVVASKSNGEDVYYNELGEKIGDYFLRYPLNFTRISSTFTSGRFHPILKVARPHHGVDFSAPKGTPVRTIADGTVEMAKYINGGGNTIRIRHNKRYVTEYMHLSKIGVKLGQSVKRGQQVGNVGQTGLATGPHLHFGFFDNGKYVDPMSIDLPTISNGNDVIPVDFINKTIESLKNSHVEVKLASNKNTKKIG